MHFKERERCGDRNVHEVQLTKLDRVKSEEMEREWGGALRRSKSMDKTTPKKKSKGRKSSGSITFNASPKMRQKCPKPDVPQDQASRASTEGTKSQGDPDIHSDGASLAPAISINSQSPDDTVPISLPKLDEDPFLSLQDQCRASLMHWKSLALVQQLQNTGFESWKAEAAVHIFGDDLESALQWLMKNPDLCRSQISSLLQHHPPTEISIDFEIQTMQRVSRHHGFDEALLQKAVIQLEGDMTSAIDGLIGHRHYGFPGCDLSLGIVHTESPFSTDAAQNAQNELDGLNDLECVLGDALEAYKSGHADFTELASQDLGYADRSPLTNSPLSQSWSSPIASDPMTRFGFGTRTHAAELRHFIGDLLE